MFPWLRLFGVGLRLIGKSKVNLLATTRVRLRVWPNDLDYNLHVNNGRYLALAHISGAQWIVRTGVLRIVRQHKALLVIGDALAKFRHDLQVFQAFEIHSRLMGWDSKWVFFEHRFVRKDRVIGVVAGRAVLKAQSGPIDPQVLSAELGHSAPSPELAEWVRCFDQSAELLGELLRNEERSKGILSAIQSPRYPQKRNPAVQNKCPGIQLMTRARGKPTRKLLNRYSGGYWKTAMSALGH